MHGTSRILIENVERSFYAEVEIDVAIGSNDGRTTIEFLGNEDRWHRGVEFGLASVIERYPRTFTRGCRIRVSLKGHEVDTTETIAAYGAAMALYAAIGVPPPAGMRIVQSTGEIIFVK